LRGNVWWRVCSGSYRNSPHDHTPCTPSGAPIGPRLSGILRIQPFGVRPNQGPERARSRFPLEPRAGPGSAYRCSPWRGGTALRVWRPSSSGSFPMVYQGPRDPLPARRFRRRCREWENIRDAPARPSPGLPHTHRVMGRSASGHASPPRSMGDECTPSMLRFPLRIHSACPLFSRFARMPS
jgi:hypothetical protein